MKLDFHKELVTVVITNFNRCDDLRVALKSVKEQDYPNVETIVVDNASCDNSLDMLAIEFPDLCVIALKENIGMDGYSVGFRHAKGEFIFQMDNDSLMPDGNVLSEVVKRFEEGPEDLAVVATRVEEYRRDVDQIKNLRRRDARIGPINTGGFHSGGVGFRKALLDEAGYYNRDVFLYGSELFLQMKFLAGGYQVLYYPEILMLHKSSNAARSPKGVYYELRNRYWFMRSHGTLTQQLRYFPAMLVHDVVYSIFKKSPKGFFKALQDGFGALPISFQLPLHSSQPDFVAKVNEFGANFSLRSLLRRIKQGLGSQ